MTRPSRLAATTLALAAAALIAGCGSAAPAGRGPAPEAAPAGAPFLATSLVTPAATWAVVVMGGSVTSHNNFWQLLTRPAGSSRWRLATPPGVPDNGGLVLASAGGRSLITAFRPSQYLTFTPLTRTADGGQAWSSLDPLDAALANVPDALTAAPGTAQLLALLTDGTVKDAMPGSASWSTLVTRRALARTPAGRRCGLASLTAASFTPAGAPMLAGMCGHAGTAGIFAASNGTWQAAGPAIPAALARQDITVLRLTQTAGHLTALLAAGTGPAASLLAAWSADSGGHWALSPPLRMHGAIPTSASLGPAGAAAIVLAGGRGEAITPGHAWRALPALPAGTATLAAGPAGTTQALAVHRALLTIWQTSPGGTSWIETQAISVPIQYGSSG